MRARTAPRRSWLFVAGADPAAHTAAALSGADVLIQELEDFTPPQLRPKARSMAVALYERWRKADAIVAVRINPFGTCGGADLTAVMAGRPQIVLMSKVATPRQVKALDDAVTSLERKHGIRAGSTELVPNIETAAGLVRALEIARSSPRISALLVASEDMVADLGTARSRDGAELAYVRARFLVECRAAGVEAIDCPYTFSDIRGARADALQAKRLGYRAKSLVSPSHAQAINRVFSPQKKEIEHARRVVRAFEIARAAGKERASVGGALIEVPIYAAAKRLLESLS